MKKIMDAFAGAHFVGATATILIVVTCTAG